MSWACRLRNQRQPNTRPWSFRRRRSEQRCVEFIKHVFQKLPRAEFLDWSFGCANPLVTIDHRRKRPDARMEGIHQDSPHVIRCPRFALSVGHAATMGERRAAVNHWQCILNARDKVGITMTVAK